MSYQDLIPPGMGFWHANKPGKCQYPGCTITWHNGPPMQRWCKEHRAVMHKVSSEKYQLKRKAKRYKVAA